MRRRARTAEAPAYAKGAGAARWLWGRHQTFLSALLVLLSASGACRRQPGGPNIRVVDLIKQIAHAETRPLGASFPIGEHTLGGRSRTSIIAPAASRIIWTLPLPHRALLRVHAGVAGDSGSASVTVRIGISDDRIYESLMVQTISSDETARYGWIAVAANLSSYAGRKLSLFYQPDRRRWRVILGTTVTSGTPAVVYLGEPGIDTDLEAAREYSRRRTTAER